MRQGESVVSPLAVTAGGEGRSSLPSLSDTMAEDPEPYELTEPMGRTACPLAAEVRAFVEAEWGSLDKVFALPRGSRWRRLVEALLAEEGR